MVDSGGDPDKCNPSKNFSYHSYPPMQQKRHVEKTPKKTSKKIPESDILGDKFDPKRPLDPQSPHSLQPTYFLRKNEVRVGERSPKDLPKPLREHQFSPFKKHIKKVGQKAPKQCPKHIHEKHVPNGTKTHEENTSEKRFDF